MKNMNSVLPGHKKKILSGKEYQYGCNCRNKTECPLDKLFNTKSYLLGRCLN